MSIQIKIGVDSFTLGSINVKRSERIDNPEKPGKKKTVPKLVPLIVPEIHDRNTAVRLFGGMFDEAEKAGPGNGLKLVHSLIEERAEWGETALGDRTDSAEPYRDAFCSVERPRSAGLSEKDILTELAALGMESNHLGPGLRGGDSWRSVVDKDTGSPLFDSEEALILRFSAISEKMEGLTAQLAQRQLRSEETKKRREEKAKAAAAAAAASAPVR